jgi:protein involved in polysaccharide export with SLBB domain
MVDMKRNRTSQHPIGSLSVAKSAAVLALVCILLTGCAAITNPLANGIPVRILPDELLAESKKDLKPISLALLRQQYPNSYKLAAGDILGIYIEGVLGEADAPPPVNITEGTNLPPSIGYPIPVRQDGTVPMPLIDPVQVEGMTVAQAEKVIVAAYEAKKILRPENKRVLVTLMRPRQTRVLVLREDSQNQYQRMTIRSRALRGLPTTQTTIGGAQFGSGAVVELPAYENDVLHAMAETGGLPGADAIEEVIVERGYWDVKADPDGKSIVLPCEASVGTGGQQSIRIPLRSRAGEELPFKPQDIILQTGDIVVVRMLKPQFYYTGGLLPAREVPIPRDNDLTMVEAILKVDGSILNGAVSTDNLNGTIVQPGLGNPNPSLLAVLRKTPNGGQVTIRVDLNRAVQDPRENILVQPGDVLILQETPSEAIGRYISQVISLQIVTKFINSDTVQGTNNVNLP